MARRAMVEVQCERCSRKETQELSSSGNGPLPEPPPVFFGRVQVLGEKPLEAKFGDLCGPCTRAVRTLFEQIAKKIEGLSPDRALKSKEPEAKGSEQPEPRATKEGPAPPAPAPRPQAAAKVSMPRSS